MGSTLQPGRQHPLGTRVEIDHLAATEKRLAGNAAKAGLS
jgi:hypothetical protein